MRWCVISYVTRPMTPESTGEMTREQGSGASIHTHTALVSALTVAETRLKSKNSVDVYGILRVEVVADGMKLSDFS